MATTPLDENKELVKVTEKVPEKEAWLYQNTEALTKVIQGLKEARQGQFSELPPDIDADLEWLEDVDDDPDEWIDC